MPRQHERIEFRVQINLLSASGQHEAYISDISETGCYIDTRVEVTDGQSIYFELIHPNGGRIAFAGEAAHHTPGVGFGVQFAELNPQQKLFVARILHTRAAEKV